MNETLFEDTLQFNKIEDDVIESNLEIIEDIEEFDPSSIVVYSRDWTIETIFSQIEKGNIDLDPDYQRRNAWTDEKRSKLIESIIIGYPVPEIVLAEDTKHRKSFAVIDGKQRLLTIAGFINPGKFGYWNKEKLSTLTVKKNLNEISFKELQENPRYSDEMRQFYNSSLRCTIITNFKQNDVLYDIFYRLNSGSVSLSTQELRQVLNRGEFANYLIATTNEVQPIHWVMNINEPDKRLRDIEIILRCISMVMFSHHYRGNLKVFLDKTMGIITEKWDRYKNDVEKVYSRINECIEVLGKIFGSYNQIGRKFTGGNPERSFNRTLLEVQLFFFFYLDFSLINQTTSSKFLEDFKVLCQDDSNFRSSIESTTKSLDNYRIRFSKFQDLMNNSFNTNIERNPFK